jgi:hypothetical protein
MYIDEYVCISHAGGTYISREKRANNKREERERDR